MKNTIKQVFHSGKFLFGFVIFMFILLTVLIYPIFVTADPLQMIGQGNFFKPGTYVSVEESALEKTYTLQIPKQFSKLEMVLDVDTRASIQDFLIKQAGVAESEIDVTDAEGLVALWKANYDPNTKYKGLTTAKRKALRRLDGQITAAMKDSGVIIAEKDEEGTLQQSKVIKDTDYINIKDVTTKTFLLGTDNFGRDVLTELVAATKSSLKIGLLAGLIATAIGLLLGLIAGYMGGLADNIIIFITNLFTVIPSFVILILISYSVGDKARGIAMVGIIIGITSWPWTTRSVRSQVISLRNRDHVNLSKLSGHSMFRIIFTDILPYIASYVVMAMILQISSGILAEAQLSMIGLGPATTKTATLGLMMQWAMQYSAHLNGSWWAYFPVVILIALISFSLNLMNTGMDQVFNPQLRD
ncbi:ABC transporter permease [Butyrivibrio sp. AC2005]|uniref:ABC transporter permease n=1 Tax=Butyrivibrio sp. AC2005 TaxID=1280672 RepID=UPI0003F97375|nr:ABC transporter permease [Butyrivibrio sp. AC2005]